MKAKRSIRQEKLKLDALRKKLPDFSQNPASLVFDIFLCVLKIVIFIIALAKEDSFYLTAKSFGFFDFTALMVLLILESFFTLFDSIRKFCQTPEEREKDKNCGCGDLFTCSFKLFMIIICGLNFSNGLKSPEISEFVKSKIPITYYITTISFFVRILKLVYIAISVLLVMAGCILLPGQKKTQTDESVEVVVLE